MNPSGDQLETRINRRTFLVVLGGSVGAVVAACGTQPGRPAAPPPSGEGQPAPLQTATIKFATVSAGAVGFLTHVMTQRGIDAKHAIQLDLTPLDPAGAERALLFKQVDAGLFPIISAARANLEGQPIRVFGPLLWSHFYGVTPSDRPYNRLADLKGRRIATLDAISGTYQGAQLLAAGEGLSFERDFEVVTSPPPAVLALLERGDVEAIFHFEPNIGNLLTTGRYKVFLDYNAEWRKLTGQNMLTIGLAAHEPWVQENREVAKRLLAAALETAKLINSDPTVFEEYREFLGLDTPEKLKAAQERMAHIYPTEWTPAIVDNADTIIKRAVELKLLDQAPERSVTVVL